LFIFGYLKPYKNELKLKHIKEYKQAYCTVCYGLRKNIGLFSTIFLNYESVFLYVFLEGITEKLEAQQVDFRCPENPLKKVKTKTNNQLLEFVVFISHSLTLLKILDNCRDSKNIIYRIIYYLLSRRSKYKKLKEKYIETAEGISSMYDELYKLEEKNCRDFDKCSATMGNVLKIIVGSYLRLTGQELLCAEDFSFHLGLWIYLVDAYEDYEKDKKRKKYNPLVMFEEQAEGVADDFAKIQYVLSCSELMLSMMIKNMEEYLDSIKIYSHIEIIKNIVCDATINTVRSIKQKNKKFKAP